MATKVKPALKTAVKKSGEYLSIQEQQELKSKYYSEATRYMDNAKDYLKQARKEGKMYRDKKYVRTACGTAYSGVLIALEGFLVTKGIHAPNKKVRKSAEFYQQNLAKLDKKLLDHFISVYQILHLYGYYDGVENANVIKEGFTEAEIIVNKIKPTNGAAKMEGSEII